jgi:hypothetical protein
MYIQNAEQIGRLRFSGTLSSSSYLNSQPTIDEFGTQTSPKNAMGGSSLRQGRTIGEDLELSVQLKIER